MITLRYDNLFDSGADILVNAVNTVGVMGGGIAAEFKRRYPEYFLEYKNACNSGYFDQHWTNLYRSKPSDQLICSLVTKKHWRDPSRYWYVGQSVNHLAQTLANWERMSSASVAIPALGCGLGGLEWNVVEPLVREAFDNHQGEVFLYPPQ